LFDGCSNFHDRQGDLVMRRQRQQPADHGRASRETILDGAFQAFATGGYRDTAIDDIAAAAEISKGGIYFHFPTKESIFRELMRTTADKLIEKVEETVASEADPIARAEAALRTVLEVFAGHRTMARLFFEAGGAGRGFQAELNALHDRFARLIQAYLDEAIAAGTIPPLDTGLTSVVWFGALDEVVARWLLAERPGRLEDAYPVLRALLLRSVGVSEARIAAGPPAMPLVDFPESHS
jgi:TetR/AcrR family transcriptional regulator, fatty acid metabolism regulator protein